MDQYQSLPPLMYLFAPPIAPFPVCPPVHTDTIAYVDDRDTGGPSPVHVTKVTTETYNVLPNDYFVCVDTATFAVTLTLPIGILGTVYVIKDCSGNADTNPITINGSGGQLIDGSGATINSPFGSIQLIFSGDEWCIV